MLQDIKSKLTADILAVVTEIKSKTSFFSSSVAVDVFLKFTKNWEKYVLITILPFEFLLISSYRYNFTDPNHKAKGENSKTNEGNSFSNSTGLVAYLNPSGRLTIFYDEDGSGTTVYLIC